ncbi:hypothetical protein GDO86_020126 [Hymenochirus boettgeri]|uniref:Olfactory receptor n=1 Tax=Hymenochirus boettgeri TaxID=247094 RepID=A0A8T2IKL3_9PIPI|nr:hypothetical protein GDO86_020126 [Hymenochirus boettgeri]
MQNFTYSQPTLLTLSFGEMTKIKYLYSVIVLLFFTMIILSNCSVILIIVLHKSLQEPMYIFISALCVNGLYGSVIFFPSLFINLLSQIQTISYIGCIIQIFGIHTYIGCEVTVLAIMAFDRYVCICNPLRYNSIMTYDLMFRLITVAWLYNVVLISILVILTIRLPLCDSVIQKIYCDNWSVVKLSCIDTTVNNIYGLLITSVMGLLPGCIYLSYFQILRVCMKSSKDFRAKAVYTCTPHMVLLNYFSSNILTEILLLRFPVNMPYEVQIIVSLQSYVIAPLLNPLIYGLKLKEIRVKILEKLGLKKKTLHTDGEI